MFKSEKDYELFLKVLEREKSAYDPEWKLLAKPFSSPGYHTTLKGGTVHPTRESLGCAVALFDSVRTGKEPFAEENRARARDIVETILSLQDTDPESKTYGIWSWFADEPLSQMAPPDWNWADFLGKELLQIVIDHREAVGEALYGRVKEGIYHACRSIMRRDMGPHYTNISIMGTFVTHTAGERFGWEDILAYAKKRLRALYDYNMGHGAFREYNSPTYTIVAVEDIARMRRYFLDPESRALLDGLNAMAWESIAKHFHYPTRQWAGPHSRCYSTIQPVTFLYRVQRALGGGVEFVPEREIEEKYLEAIPLELFRNETACPPEFLRYFIGFPGDHDANCAYIKPGMGETPALAAAWMTADYALSSFYHSTFWNQVRALLLYFGDAENPHGMALRCLHDFYDFASGAIHSVQREDTVVSVVNFATDGGDTHCNLDMVKDATIEASDLRLRFEISGVKTTDDVAVEEVGPGRFRLDCRGASYWISVPYAVFGEGEASFAFSRGEGKAFVDVILYMGEKKPIRFAELSKAACGLVLSAGREAAASAREEGNTLVVESDGLVMTGSLKSAPFAELNSFGGSVDGKAYL